MQGLAALSCYWFSRALVCDL